MNPSSILNHPRIWAWAAGGWLIVGDIAQAGLHLWQVAGEHGMAGELEFAMNAMKQAFFLEPLQPSLWRRYRMLSGSLALFFVFGGAVPCMLAWLRTDLRTLAAAALLSTVFWTGVFGFYAFFDPVVLPLAVAAVAVPLHATLWLVTTAARLRDFQEVDTLE